MPLPQRLLDEATGTQVGKRVVFRYRRQPRHAAATDRDHDLTALGGVTNVAAELIVQLANTDLTLERSPMWRHAHHYSATSGSAT